MSMQRKRNYGDQGGYNKASRMVGGRTLTYRPSAPVAGSSRYRATLGPVSRQAMRTGGWANPSQSPELKFIDTSVSVNLTAGSLAFSAPQLLNGVAPGSGATDRIGRKIILKSVYLRATVRASVGSAGSSPIRCIIFYDKQANAQAPTATDLLLANEFNSQNNLSNRDRFVVLSDETTEPVGTLIEQARCHVVYKKLNLETMFNAGSAGTIGDITSGSIYIMFAQTSDIITSAAQAVYRVRVRFSDP